MSTPSLQKLFAPQRLAVIGTAPTPDALGALVLRNLVGAGYGGAVYPVSGPVPAAAGIQAFAATTDIGEPVDLAVLALPAAEVPAALRDCGAAGIGAAVVLSGGFREAGVEGSRLEAQVAATARELDIRLLGPNSLGYLRPAAHLNVSAVPSLPPAGHIAFFSQSGALGTAVLDWATAHQVGLSAFVSLGAMADVDFGDLIDHFGADPLTTSIILYVESIGDARAFMGAARHFAMSKPIIAVKSGRAAHGAPAAGTHSGVLADDDTIYSAAFRRAGVVRVDEIEDLFDASEALGFGRRPDGSRLAILTNAAGPGIMACDRLLQLGGRPAMPSPETTAALVALFPLGAAESPVNVGGDATAGRYAAALQALLADPACDGVLAIVTAHPGNDPAAIAQALVAGAEAHPFKPLLACFMGEIGLAAGIAILESAHVPTYDAPERAVRAYMYMHEYAQTLKDLYESPADIVPGFAPQRQTVAQLLATAAGDGRRMLSDPETKTVLSAYGIPVNPTLPAATAEECAAAAVRTGFPVALKILSPDITFKSDVGGVALDVRSPEEATAQFSALIAAAQAARPEAAILGVTVEPMSHGGYETIIGARRHPVFGPALLFGMGGTEVELYRDVAVDFPPLNEALARSLIARTRIAELLQGYRNSPPADLLALERTLVKMSYLLVDFPEIVEIDINPLVVRAGGVCALNARLLADPPSRVPAATRGSHLIIPAFPTKYRWALRAAGEGASIRAIRPEDEPLWAEMVASLSPITAEQRFFGSLGRVSKSMLVRHCHIDYDREIALVAVREAPSGETLEILGHASITLDSAHAKEGEFAIVLRDDWQNRGIGRELMEALIAAARDHHMDALTGYVLTANQGMMRFSRRLGFDVRPSAEPEVRQLLLRL